MSYLNYKKEIGDTAWITALQVLNYLIPLIVWPYLMKVLGAEQFGFFSFGFAVAQYLIIIVDFGFNLSATKQIALAKNNPQEINRIFTATLCAKAGLLAVSFLILVVISLIPCYVIYRPVMLIMFLMTVSCTFFFVWLFQGLGKIRKISIINGLSKIAILPFVFLFVKSPQDMLLAAVLQSCGYLLTAIVVVIYIHHHHYASFCKIKTSDVREMLRQSTPLFVSTAASSVYTMLFIVIIAWFVTPDEVGKYSAADKLMRYSTVILWVPLSQAFFPLISALSKDDFAKGRKIVRKLVIIVACGALLLGGVLFFAAEPLCTLLGKGYSGMHLITRIMSVLPLFIATGGIIGQLGIVALGDEKSKTMYRNIYIAAACLSVCLVIPLTNCFSSVGASIAAVVTECFVCISMIALYLSSVRKVQTA